MPEEKAGATREVEREQRKNTVLVVEDDSRVQELLQITLSHRGFVVHSASNGLEALNLVREKLPDLIVLDVRLPKKSGYEVCEILKSHEEYRRIPIVMISANGSSEARLQGLKLGADDYLAKPFSPRELIMRIQRILDRVEDSRHLAGRAEALEGEVRRERESLGRAQQELQSQLARLGTMIGLIQDLSHAMRLPQLLESFVLTTVGYLDLDVICLLTAPSENVSGPPEGAPVPITQALFAPQLWRGMEDRAVKSLRIAANGPLARHLARQKRPLTLDEMDSIPEVADESKRLAAVAARIAAPVVTGDKIVALVLAGDRSSGRPLDRFDAQMLLALSNSIAVAIDNTAAFEKVQSSFVSTVTFLISAVEARTPFMAGHSERVAAYSMAIGRALALPSNDLESLRVAALLHDLGMLELYEDVMASRPLTEDETRAVQSSPARAAGLVESLGQAGSVAAIVRHHQERWDGYGYPDRLQGEQIPLGARIMCVANAFDAMCSNRPYRGALSVNEALDHLVEKAGAQFDPKLANRFVEGIRSGEFAVG
jgi:response regulator RpfG family c-di-GMP phosphodiesterase